VLNGAASSSPARLAGLPLERILDVVKKGQFMVTRGIDFAALSLKDALDLALLVEEESRDRYEVLADQLEANHAPDAAGFFRRMVRVEELHRSELERRRNELFPRAARTVSRAMLFDVEAPGSDVARADLTVRGALEAALASEVTAHEFFVAALPQLVNADVKALFLELSAEELEHQQWVKLELDRAPAAGRGDS
jgi:rubrerythrin